MLNRRTFGKIIAGLFATPLAFLRRKSPNLVRFSYGEKMVFIFNRGIDVPEEFLDPTKFSISRSTSRNYKQTPITPPKEELIAKFRAAHRNTKFKPPIKQTKDESKTVMLYATKSNGDVVPQEFIRFARHPRRKG